jgi:hypothetical protein
MDGHGLRLELEPPVAGEQHLDPDVDVIGLDQVAAVLLQDLVLTEAPETEGLCATSPALSVPEGRLGTKPYSR